MRSSLPLLLLLWCFFSPAAAQYDSAASSKPRYFVSLHTGGLFGKKEFGTSFTASLIQGVRYKRFALGAGIGYDAYRDWRAMPLFISLNYDFSRLRGNSFFIQVNAGASVVRNPTLTENDFTYYENDNLFVNPLVGYRVAGDKFNLYLSAGYKFQSIEYGWSWGWGGARTYVGQDIERLSLQLGFGFR